jgi:hypothetical protein
MRLHPADEIFRGKRSLDEIDYLAPTGRVKSATAPGLENADDRLLALLGRRSEWHSSAALETMAIEHTVAICRCGSKVPLPFAAAAPPTAVSISANDFWSFLCLMAGSEATTLDAFRRGAGAAH